MRGLWVGVEGEERAQRSGERCRERSSAGERRGRGGQGQYAGSGAAGWASASSAVLGTRATPEYAGAIVNYVLVIENKKYAIKIY